VGCEETEFCIRAVRAIPAGKLVLVPGAEVQHAVSTERGRPSYLLRRCFYEGISKALVRRLGDPRSLDTERQYIRGALTARVRVSGKALLEGSNRAASLGQIAATVAALVAAAMGYVFGMTAFALRPPRLPTPPAQDRVREGDRPA
jgi:hypothetical protein